MKTDFPLMRDVMLYMTRYPDQFHHPKEDLLFTALAIRGHPMQGTRDNLKMHTVEDCLEHRPTWTTS